MDVSAWQSGGTPHVANAKQDHGAWIIPFCGRCKLWPSTHAHWKAGSWWKGCRKERPTPASKTSWSTYGSAAFSPSQSPARQGRGTGVALLRKAGKQDWWPCSNSCSRSSRKCSWSCSINKSCRNRRTATTATSWPTWIAPQLHMMGMSFGLVDALALRCNFMPGLMPVNRQTARLASSRM